MKKEKDEHEIDLEKFNENMLGLKNFFEMKEMEKIEYLKKRIECLSEFFTLNDFSTTEGYEVMLNVIMNINFKNKINRKEFICVVNEIYDKWENFDFSKD